MKKSILGIVLFLLMGSANATDYKTLLNGKTLYIKGGNCAGLSLAKILGLWEISPLVKWIYQQN